MITTICLCLGALASVAVWYFYWNSHARQFEKSGYVPPATSWFGEFGMASFAWVLTFLTVGKVKVVRKSALPKGRLVFAGNHQMPCDFAMVRRGSGRHFRMLTASDQLGGFFGLLCAVGGVISVAFKQKTDGAAAEQACNKALAGKSFRGSFKLALAIWAVLAAAFVFSLVHALTLPAIACVVMALALAGCPGSEQALGIFPQGSLLPDDQQLVEKFRPGAVRIARAASEIAAEPVQIVPVAIYYKRDPACADWTHRYLKGMRSMFEGLRNPKVWEPIFKVNLDELQPAERAEVEALRKEKMRAYKKSKVTIYGGVVVVGEPIDTRNLPADPIEAIEIIRAKIAELLAEARTL